MYSAQRETDSIAALSQARALYYDFFAGCFLYELLCERESVLLKQIKLLKQSPLNDSDSAHFDMLETQLKTQGIDSIIAEYTHTFLLPFAPPKDGDMPQESKRRKKGEVFYHNPQVMLYLSHYEEGCLNGSALLKARRLTKQSSFRLNASQCKESEEHLGFLCLLMRYLLCSSHKEDIALVAQIADELVVPLGDFVTDTLIKRDDVVHYAHIAMLLRSFLSVERYLEVNRF